MISDPEPIDTFIDAGELRAEMARRRWTYDHMIAHHTQKFGVGISRQTIAACLRGDTSLRGSTVLRFAEVLGMRPKMTFERGIEKSNVVELSKAA